MKGRNCPSFEISNHGPEKPWAQTRIISCRILPFKLIENVHNILIIKIKKKNHRGEYDD